METTGIEDEFHAATKGKYEELTSDDDRSLLCKAHRYIDFLESKIKDNDRLLSYQEKGKQ